jgi:hypothetical protein
MAPDVDMTTGEEMKYAAYRKAVAILPPGPTDRVLEALAGGQPVVAVDSQEDADAADLRGMVGWVWPNPSPDLSKLASGSFFVWARKDAVGAQLAVRIVRDITQAGLNVEIREGRASDTLAEHLRRFDFDQAGPLTLRELDERAGISLNSKVPRDGTSKPAEAPPVSGAEIDGSQWPTFHEDALYGLAGRIIRELEPNTEADRAAMLLTLLAAYGNAVGSGPHAIADAAKHPARLFPCIVGDTAKARKGTAWRNIAQILEIADPEWMRSRVKSGLSSGEGLIAAVADPVTDSDGNVVNTGTNDRRLFVIEEEFARMLQVAKREANTISPVVRHAYDTGTLSVMTKQPQTATDAHISIEGHITIEELRAKLSETDMANGLANRFLFVCAKRSKRLADAPQHDHALIDRLGADLGAALRSARKVGLINRSPDAKALWADLYNQMADDEPGGLLGAVVARPEANTLRLAICYALLDGSRVIEVPHLRAAWAVWRYCRASAEYIFGDAVGDAQADKLWDAIFKAGPAGLDFTSQSALFGRNVDRRRMEVLRARLGKRIVNMVVKTGGADRHVSIDARFATPTEQ